MAGLVKLSIPEGAIDTPTPNKALSHRRGLSIPEGAIDTLEYLYTSTFNRKLSIPEGAIDTLYSMEIELKFLTFNTRRCD